MKRLAVIHFQPLELYPPVTNFINYITGQAQSIRLKIFTTTHSSHKAAYNNDKAVIYRFGKSGTIPNRFQRLYNYMLFYGKTFLSLLACKPDTVLYYETLSFLPVYGYMLFSRLSGKKVSVFCHYHEYVSPAEYNAGMWLYRVVHKLEKKFYHRMKWISHTNDYRMDLFKRDHADTHLKNTYILPNYPPSAWLNTNARKSTNGQLSIICVGSIGMETMYIKEFAEWVESKKGLVKWDVYSQQEASDFRSFLASIDSKHINFKGYVNYYELPQLLSNYDVGVILYKAHIPNVTYCASNKLFEYMVVGLDVWLPNVMIGSLPYVSEHTKPKILSLDFDHFNKFDLELALRPSEEKLDVTNYYCEKVYAGLFEKIIQPVTG